MITRPVALRLFWGSVAVVAAAFATFVVVDTLRTVVPLWSPLPWFDEWATVKLLRAVKAGELSWWEMLFAQHNEHRILVPRLVFLADDALFRGQGRLSLAAIFATQALHAGLFAVLVLRARPRRAGRWALVAVVVALMFSLRQAENFTSGFQVAFVGVFAGATLGFVLFGLAVARARAGRPVWPALAGSFAAVLAASFTMANGLAAAALLPVLALAARIRLGVVLACAAWALVWTLAYLHGYEPVAHHSLPADSLRHPVAVTAYVATYLGSLWTSGKVAQAEVLGGLGLLATLAALLRVGRRPDAPPAALALVGVMLFAGAAAAVTASGRLGFGIGQALSSRYAAGSAAFWAAQLTYWWIDPPRRIPAASTHGAVLAVAAGLCLALAVEQRAAKPAVASQSFALAESTDLLLLGLHDPAVLGRSAWVPEDVERLLPVLRDDGLSIFATPEAAMLGRPVAVPPGGGVDAACGGGIAVAVADPGLGQGGVRVSGSGWVMADHRILRRILLTDAAGRVVGLASGPVPGAPWSAWRGFVVAPVGAPLTAFGRRADGTACRLGSSATVSAAPER